VFKRLLARYKVRQLNQD